jgi:hypothetical protein
MKNSQPNLPQPPRSWSRKMSMRQVIRIQIQMKNKVNQSMLHSSSPVPNSARVFTRPQLIQHDGRWARGPGLGSSRSCHNSPSLRSMR